MKTLTFSTRKQPLLRFEAADTQFSPEDGSFLIHASGDITFQDTPLLEDIINHSGECLLEVSEENETLLEGHFHTLFMVLEQDNLVARITPI